jgi:hypothetical protein
MKNFLINLGIIVGCGVIIFILFPDMVKQIFGVYNGLGILPVFILMVLLAALPRRRRRW